MIQNYPPCSSAAFTPVKKIDIGVAYMIFVMGIQPPKDSSDDIAEQTHLVFTEIKSLLELAGASLDDCVRAVIYLTDMNDMKIVSPIRAEYFKNSKPCATTVAVNGFTRPNAKIEIEVTAVMKK
ncbi:MAG: RidA family protein [Alphaproteobacteria bacterium]|nr:RidA family protein [Alphaproteobacteria bacterium]